MYTQQEYENNPLHGTSLEQVLTELVDHYGWEILAAYLNLNCFKKNPSIKASIKFVKKTEWAQHKVESFYLYQFKNLPRATDEMFELPPRERIVPLEQKPRAPQELSLEDAERLRLKKASASRQRDNRNSPWSGNQMVRQQTRKNTAKSTDQRSHTDAQSTAEKTFDPYQNFNKKHPR
ncbi:VF530 family DNA-binding protein [Thalassotalea ponticola]|uniref:VF530 family protein n=1 Tax=Thalassotalea ponticola TaxID=1523392 RepID=UPI0025B47BE5|nr:VF530 family DNA-binding protein [Thalassotalea ponticola]MDN3651843.1 VF530 family DNA-binding protein [Thalassotalea ponticola]